MCEVIRFFYSKGICSALAILLTFAAAAPDIGVTLSFLRQHYTIHIMIEIKIKRPMKLATEIAAMSQVIPSGPRKYFS
jgi:hypothetical protein